MSNANYFNPGYGFTPENPVQLTSITASLHYLSGLLTSGGLHLLFHRRGSLSTEPVIDHYELVDTSGHYYDIYISIYSDINVWIPPNGFTFDDNLKYFFQSGEGVMDGIVFQDDILDLSLEADEDEIEIEDEDEDEDVPYDLDDEIFKLSSLPRLEMILDESFGVNYFLDDFPFSIIRELVDRNDHDFPYVHKSQYGEYYGDIKPRE